MSATQFAVPCRTNRALTALRRFLLLDALVTGANALAYLAASEPLGRLLGVGSGLLLELGLVLAVYAAGVGLLAARPEPRTWAVRTVIEINLAWTVLSFAAPALWLSPSTAGAVWVPLQALTVASFAALQYTALRAGNR